MSRLILVRHGESAWNAARLLQGQADPDLSLLGEAQAQALAPLLTRMGSGPAVCSDLRRAARTAVLLGLEARPDPRWREIGVGEWAGRNTDALRREAPDTWRGWRAGRITPPGGEDWDHFRARLRDALNDLSEDYVVVTHGGVIRAVTALLLDVAPDRLAPVPPASITVLERGDWPRLRNYGLSVALGDAAPD